MKRMVVVFLLILLVGAGPVQAERAEQEVLAKAQAILNFLQEEDYGQVLPYFQEELRDQLGEEQLQETWETLNMQVGNFQELLAIEVSPVQEFKVVILTCKFQAANIDIQISFDSEGMVAGLFFNLSQYQGEYAVPPYVDEEKFEEEEIELGEDPWTLPGLLTLPRGEGPWPALIILGGSGPTDAQGTLGPNQPYRDLAWGLAGEGIAVLRFDKRTRAYSEEMGRKTDLTVEHEYIEDGLFALDYLKTREDIDQDLIVLGGHSQGAMMVPRIAARAEESPAGLLFLAAPARRFEDLILEQFKYLAELEEEITPEIEAQLQEIKEQVERIKDPDLAPDWPAEELLGIPASYWLDLRQYDQVQVARELDLPMLFIQGGRDYQVTTEDFALWQEALAGRDDVEFVLLEDLNHIFHTGETMAVPGEYLQQGHVALSVLADIHDWIK